MASSHPFWKKKKAVGSVIHDAEDNAIVDLPIIHHYGQKSEEFYSVIMSPIGC